MSTSLSENQKVLIGAIITAVLAVGLSAGAVFLWNHFHGKTDDISQNTSKSELIRLDDAKEDIIISAAGSYTLQGKTTHSVVVDAENAEVELILDGVEINQPETAAIIGKNANKITINLAANSQNSLSDGGSSDYDACIFSNADLYFTGDGQLAVVGQQEEGEGIATEAKNLTFDGNGTYFITSADDGLNAGGDGGTITISGGNFYIDASGDGIDSNKNAIINGGTIFVMGSDVGGDAGIDTDDGFEINGGTVIALGSDMIEAPLASSTQTTLAITLDQAITENTPISLKLGEQEILSFAGSKGFKTLIISSPDLTEGEYTLYQDGSSSGELTQGIYRNGVYTGGAKIPVNDSETLSVKSGINSLGKSMGGPGGMGSGGREDFGNREIKEESGSQDRLPPTDGINPPPEPKPEVK